MSVDPRVILAAVLVLAAAGGCSFKTDPAEPLRQLPRPGAGWVSSAIQVQHLFEGADPTGADPTDDDPTDDGPVRDGKLWRSPDGDTVAASWVVSVEDSTARTHCEEAARWLSAASRVFPGDRKDEAPEPRDSVVDQCLALVRGDVAPEEALSDGIGTVSSDDGGTEYTAWATYLWDGENRKLELTAVGRAST